MKFYLKVKSSHLRKCIWKCRLQKWCPFCLGLNVFIWILWYMSHYNRPSMGYTRQMADIQLIRIHEHDEALQACMPQSWGTRVHDNQTWTFF